MQSSRSTQSGILSAVSGELCVRRSCIMKLAITALRNYTEGTSPKLYSV
jgi:hypothetical protein